MAKLCTECGTQLEEGARFCVECGAEAPEATAETPVVTEAAAPAPPAPPEPPAAPAQPAGPPLTVRVPGWLAFDWFGAVTFAFLALVIGLVIQYVLGVFLILIQWVPEGGSIEWSETLRAPLTFFLAFHGPLDGVGVWLTAALWIWISFRIAAGLLAPERLIPKDAAPSRMGAFVAKIGLIYVIPVTVLAAVLDPEPSALTNASTQLGSGFRDPYRADWNVAVTFFLGLILVLLVTALVLARRSGKTVMQTFGLSRSFDWPPIMGAAWAGARRTLLITLPLLLTLAVVGSLLEYAGTDGVTFRDWLAVLLLLLYAGVLLSGADIAVFFSILSMRFFIGDDYVAFGERPAWMWAGVAIMALGFLLGGFLAAQRRKPENAGQAALAGLLVGPMVAVMLFVAAWFVIGVPEKAVVGPALGLPLLWALVSFVGGLLYANRQGLVSGLEFEVASPPAEE